MTKDDIVKIAKENFNVSLNPKDKLADLELQLKSLESSAPVEENEIESSGETPVYSRGEFGKIVPWHPDHRPEFWNFIYDESGLSAEEKKKLGL
jgi:hypothetical protein